MSSSRLQKTTTTQWIILIAVLVIALINPLYIYYKNQSTDNIWRLGLDLRGGVSMVYKADFAAAKDPTEFNTLDKKIEALNGAVAVVRQRIDPTGTMELEVTHNNNDRILIQVPGVKEKVVKEGDLTVDRLTKLLGSTAQLEFVYAGTSPLVEGTDISEKIKSKELEVHFTGNDLKKAEFKMDNQARPIVAFEWKGDAGNRFGEFTSAHVNEYMAIVLDGKVISCPVIKSAIWGGSGIIEGGGFTNDTVDLLVRQLNGGRLPVPLEKSSVRFVGPTLGQASINTSLIAGYVAFGLIALFMITFYRLSGLIATIALILFVALNLGFISLFKITLTLPGIAGLVLSVGMAVDCNVIIFERLKEEFIWGKSTQAAIDTAFDRAWVAIFDSHVTLILTSILLYLYGEGPIKGFAVTVILGALLSLYSAVTVTKVMIQSATSSGLIKNKRALV